MRETKEKVRVMLQEFMTLDVQHDEWDETPWAALILRGDDDKVMLERMPVPDEMWNVAPVYRVIQALAQTTRRFTERGWMWAKGGDALLGVALFTEGWGVSVSASGDALKQVQAYTEGGGRLQDHPLGVECKMVTAALVGGDWVMVTYFRNGDTIEPDYKDGPEGRVPEAVKELLDAFSAGKVRLSEGDE